MAEGKIVQIIGPVVDIDFSDGALPQILNAVVIPRTNIEGVQEDLVVEVQLHLGENRYYCCNGFNRRFGEGNEGGRYRRTDQSPGRPESARKVNQHHWKTHRRTGTCRSESLLSNPSSGSGFQRAQHAERNV